MYGLKLTERKPLFLKYITYTSFIEDCEGKMGIRSFRSRHSQTRAGAEMDQQAQAYEGQQQQAQRQIEAQQRQIEALQQQKKQQPTTTTTAGRYPLKSCKNMLTYTKKDYYLIRNFSNSRRTCYQRFNLESAPRW